MAKWVNELTDEEKASLSIEPGQKVNAGQVRFAVLLAQQVDDPHKALDRMAKRKTREADEWCFAHGTCKAALDAVEAMTPDARSLLPGFLAKLEIHPRGRTSAQQKCQSAIEGRKRSGLSAHASTACSKRRCPLGTIASGEMETNSLARKIRARPAKRKRRPGKPQKPRPLTALQTEAVQIVCECKGNVAKAAKQIGKDRKTVEKAYRAGLGKLGKTAYLSRDKTRLLPRDKRGVDAVSEEDDRRRQ